MLVNRAFAYTGFLGLLMLSSCQGKLGPQRFVTWVENPQNGLHKTKEMGVVVFDLQYYPAVYTEIKHGLVEPREVQKEEGLKYFGLKLVPSDGTTSLLQWNTSNEMDFLQRKQYFDFRFHEDIYLRCGVEEIPCSYFIAENNGGLSPELRFTLGFDVKQEDEDLQVIVVDRVFGNGEVKFLFKQKHLKKIPEVDFNS